MRIVICGSSAFKKEMVEYRNRLRELGHEPIIHPVYEELAAGRMLELMERIEREHAAVKKEYDFIRWYHNAIANSDAILVLNFDKSGVENYIGGNTLMEIGFAHINNKKVFLLNDVPENVSYSEEIKAMADIVINGDLEKIK